MDKQCVIDTLGWGLVLWLIGYVLGILLFFALPVSLIGWAYPACRRHYHLLGPVQTNQAWAFRYYAMLAVAWDCHCRRL